MARKATQAPAKMISLPKQNRYKDFDDMLSEARSDTITIRVFGKDYTAPATMPAYVPIMLARYAGDEVMSQKITYDAAAMIFGWGAVEEWVADPRMTVDKMDALIMEVFALMYGAPEDEGPQEVNEGDDGVQKAPK